MELVGGAPVRDGVKVLWERLILEGDNLLVKCVSGEGEVVICGG